MAIHVCNAIGCFAFSQTSDTVTIHHKYYSTTFSKSKHLPVAAKYWITKNMLDRKKRVARTNNFRPDPLLPKETDWKKDYAHSGYGQGHNMDVYDNGCDSVGMSGSFYYSNLRPPNTNFEQRRMEKSGVRERQCSCLVRVGSYKE